MVDRLQLLRPLYVAPKLCAASSITARPCFAAMALISSMSAGWPYKETGMIARVFGVMAAAMREASIFAVSSSTSTKTGFAPSKTIISPVATNVKGVVMISSPGLMSSAIKAISNASVPDATVMQCFAPV